MSTTTDEARDARSITDDYLSQAWAAFEDHRLERGSGFIWKATEVALRCAAAKRGMTVDTPDERIKFVELLDAENGKGRHYIGWLMFSEYFRDNAEMGVMPGDDNIGRDARMSVEFIDFLLAIGQSSE